MKKLFVLIITILYAALSSCAAPGRAVLTGTPPPRATVAPSPSPSPPTTERAKDRAKEILEGMTPEEKICQMLVIRIDDVTGRRNETRYGEEFRAGLAEYPVGGLVFFTENIVSSEQVRGMVEAARETAKIPLLISADEEGGRVRRLNRRLPTTSFEPMYSYRHEGEGRAHDNAQQIARDMLDYGFNLDFAPVADVWTNPENTVIGDRAYSSDAHEAARLVASAVRGFLDGGVIPTLKHFPGHGDTELDSHNGPVYSDTTLEILREREFLPFISGLEAGAPIVMLSHITMNAIDPDNPTTFSAALIGILREELGFDGVITTDALDMGAMGGLTYPEIAVRAVEAGCDILLGIKDVPEVVEALRERVSEVRINESVMRILELKLEFGIME